MQPTYTASFAAEPQHVRPARAAVRAYARICGFSGSELTDIELAAGEAISNAVEYAGGSDRSFSVRCECSKGELRIEVSNSGNRFRVPARALEVLPNERNRGFGIFIMRRLMDGVTFARDGTRVRMRKRRLLG
jgi:anti-sigma regulatory factor (Ser/Thr protein kinase)